MLQNESKIIVIVHCYGTLTHSSLNTNAIYNRDNFFLLSILNKYFTYLHKPFEMRPFFAVLSAAIAAAAVAAAAIVTVVPSTKIPFAAKTNSKQ